MAIFVKTQKMPVAAVITGDIVDSTLLAKDKIVKLLNELKVLFKPYKFEFYRGDSFQLFLKKVDLGLIVGLRARTIAKKYSIDIRTSIGIGEVVPPIRSLRTASGTAFVLSGRAFDALSNERFKIQSYKEEANVAFRVVAYFVDHIFDHLTPSQAEVVEELLKGYAQIDVALRLGKAQPTINKLVQAADWDQIERLLEEYQNIITQFKIA